MAIELTVTYLTGSKQNLVETVRGAPVWLGRAEKCQVRFDPTEDLKVSGLHAELREAEGRVTVHDLGSRNGVYLNGVKVEESAEVPNRATIQLGKDGPRIRLSFEEAAGGIDFKRVRRDTRRKLDRDQVLASPSLLSTDESLKAYTPEQLGLTPSAGEAAPQTNKALLALLLGLAALGVIAFQILR